MPSPGSLRSPPSPHGRGKESKRASSARFYDPGASPLFSFFPRDQGARGVDPGKMPGERSAAGRFRSYVIRTAASGWRTLGMGGVRPDVGATTSAHTPGGAPRGGFCPRTVSDKPAMRRLSRCARSGHGGQLWRAPRSGSRTVDRGLPGMACETIRRRRIRSTSKRLRKRPR